MAVTVHKISTLLCKQMKRNERVSPTRIMASSSVTNTILREQYDEMFGSSESDSDENSDRDISVSEESGSVEESESELEESAETADEDEPSWRVNLTNIEVDDFVLPTGIPVELSEEATELASFKLLFGDHIVAQTNLYAQQKLSGNPQTLEKWTEVTANEAKGIFWCLYIYGPKFFAVYCRLLVS